MTRKGTYYQMCKNGISKKGLLLILFLAPLLTGFELLGFAYHSWHQKMTVEVEVGDQLYTGSSVVKMSVFGHPDMPLVHGNLDLEILGEAVMVELPQNQYLFALLTYNAFLASRVFADKMEGALTESGNRWAAIIAGLHERRNIDPQDYTLLVTFSDINDPKTVQKVDPDNLAATFGSGVSLKRIILEITDEPVTEGKIESVLGWLKTIGGGMLDGRRISTINAENRLANDLTRVDFIR